jgi:hypothetical protein
MVRASHTCASPTKSLTGLTGCRMLSISKQQIGTPNNLFSDFFVLHVCLHQTVINGMVRIHPILSTKRNSIHSFSPNLVYPVILSTNLPCYTESCAAATSSASKEISSANLRFGARYATNWTWSVNEVAFTNTKSPDFTRARFKILTGSSGTRD